MNSENSNMVVELRNSECHTLIPATNVKKVMTNMVTGEMSLIITLTEPFKGCITQEVSYSDVVTIYYKDYDGWVNQVRKEATDFHNEFVAAPDDTMPQTRMGEMYG